MLIFSLPCHHYHLPRCNLVKDKVGSIFFWKYQLSLGCGHLSKNDSFHASLGAVSAIQDAVILSNCINDIENFTFENIQEAFTDYKSQRYKHVAMQANLSKFLGRVMFGQVLKKIVTLLRILFYSPYAHSLFQHL